MRGFPAGLGQIVKLRISVLTALAKVRSLGLRDWVSWLQENRVELNAMSTPQFLAWLEGKIQLYDKRQSDTARKYHAGKPGAQPSG